MNRGMCLEEDMQKVFSKLEELESENVELKTTVSKLETLIKQKLADN